jgi:mono/diheme cytochrome c family protein
MRKDFCGLILLALLAPAGFARAQAPAPAAGVDFFEKKIRPLFAQHCYECHSVTGKDIKGGLRLDTPEGITKGGENGPVIAAGNPDGSKLIQAVRQTLADLKMPPKTKLKDQEIADLTEWVKLGAPMPTAAAVPATPLHDSSAR